MTDEHGYRLPLTTTLPPGHSLESVALAPTMFQPYVDKAFELRCVVMGDKIFAAKLDSQASEDSRIDWRGGDPEHEIFELPKSVQVSLRRLMDSFDLNFASLDMIVTPDGEFVFLELNPNGQWLWLEYELGMPLVATMADLLTTNYDTGGHDRGCVLRVCVAEKLRDGWETLRLLYAMDRAAFLTGTVTSVVQSLLYPLILLIVWKGFSLVLAGGR